MSHSTGFVRVKQLIQRLLLLVFDIREGEYRRALLMQVNIFLIILVLLIVKPMVSALFLANVGVERLPVLFVLVAVTAMLVALAYSRLLGRVALKGIISGTIAAATSGLAAASVLLRILPGSAWIYYVFYILIAIFGVVATSQVWILANLLFNAREATRLFGFIGAGAIAGGIAGGYVTSILAPIISIENLMLVAAVLVTFCLPLSSSIWSSSVPGLTYLQQARRMTTFGEHPLRAIMHSRHLTYLACIVGVGVIVAKLVDYQFSALAVASIQSEDELAAFFGFWFSTFNVISLLIQLFITNRIVGLYGVGYSLFVLPFAIIFGASLLLILPVLSVGIFTKAADVTLKQSIHKSATELLALPIPASIKNQAKSFIDIFVDSAATGIGGLILIFLVSGLDLSVRLISLIILPVALLWIYFALGVRREYIRSFKLKITRPEKDTPTLDSNVLSDSVVGGLQAVLRSGSAKQIRIVLQKIIESKDRRLVEDVHSLLKNSDASVRESALRTLYFYRSPDYSSEVEGLLHDPDQNVRMSAVEYLVEHEKRDRIGLMDRLIKSDDAAVNGAALVALAEESRNNPEMIRVFRLEQAIRDKLSYLSLIADSSLRKQYTRNIIRAAGYANLSEFYPIIDRYLLSDDPPLVREAVMSAARTLNRDYIPRICSFLDSVEYRQTAIDALSISGNGVLRLLSEHIDSDTIDRNVIRWLPRVAERQQSQDAVQFLFQLLEYGDSSVQVETLRSLNAMKMNHPFLVIERKDVIELILDESRLYLGTLSILYGESRRLVANPPGESREILSARNNLISLLEKRLDVILERIFRLLGLKYPPEEIIPVLEGLRSDSSDIRANSVEYLDSLLHGNLKRTLIPIVETAMLETISEETIRQLNLEIPDQLKCFSMILRGRDVRLKRAVLHLIEQLRDESYVELVDEFVDHKDPRVRDLARRIAAVLRDATI